MWEICNIVLSGWVDSVGDPFERKFAYYLYYILRILHLLGKVSFIRNIKLYILLVVIMLNELIDNSTSN